MPRLRQEPHRRTALKSAGGRGRTVFVVFLLAWTLVSTWAAIGLHFARESEAQVHAAARAADEEKLRVLTRRYVGVASYGALEREGLAGRMAEVIARQAQLEDQQEALGVLVTRLTGAFLPSPSPPQTGPGGGRTKDEPAPLRNGSKTRAALDGISAAPREQLTIVEASIQRLASAETETIARLSKAVDTALGRFREALGRLGPDVRALLETSDGTQPKGSEASLLGAAAFAHIEARATEFGRLRATAEILPLRRPVAGTTLTSNFGMRKDPFTGAAAMHAGIDFRAVAGTPVLATSHGKITTARFSNGYGNLVEIDHGAGFTTRYGHLSQIDVKEGQEVAAGDAVGAIGSTGRSTGPHLHYETRVGGNPIDPTRLLEIGTALFGLPANVANADRADVADDALAN
jgi:murein DD-endopeptidase MepM/ murein hydrolase activator NlpD